MFRKNWENSGSRAVRVKIALEKSRGAKQGLRLRHDMMKAKKEGPEELGGAALLILQRANFRQQKIA